MQPAWKKIHLPPPQLSRQAPPKNRHHALYDYHGSQKLDTKRTKDVYYRSRAKSYWTRCKENQICNKQNARKRLYWSQTINTSPETWREQRQASTADTSPKESKYASSLYKRIQKSICWHTISSKSSILQPPSERICHHDSEGTINQNVVDVTEVTEDVK